MNNTKLKENYGTLSETVNALIEAGYTLDFNMQEECIVCHKADISLPPEEFQIDKVYRFEGMTNPDDEAVVYAISSPKNNIKGVLVNGYGISADEASSKLINKLQTNHPADYDAATVRPDANRVIDASQVIIDTDKVIAQLKSEGTWHEREHNAITIFKSHTMRLVLLGLHDKAELKTHKANGMISVQVLQGRIQFITEQATSTLDKGQVLMLHENIKHSVIALQESFVLLTIALNIETKGH